MSNSIRKRAPSGVARFRNRAGRCYEIAWLAVVRQRDPNLRLIHGTLHGVIGHAWVLSVDDGTVYDPTLNRWLDGAVYQAQTNGVVERTYTAQEAEDYAYRTRIYGCWHEGCGMHANMPNVAPLSGS